MCSDQTFYGFNERDISHKENCSSSNNAAEQGHVWSEEFLVCNHFSLVSRSLVRRGVLVFYKARAIPPKHANNCLFIYSSIRLRQAPTFPHHIPLRVQMRRETIKASVTYTRLAIVTM